MEHTPAKKNLGLLLVFILITACSSAGGSSTQPALATATLAASTNTETPSQAVEPTTSGESTLAAPSASCANPYYPVREGSTWTYQSTGSPAGNYSFTDTITALRPDGYTLTSKFDTLTRTQEWACKPEGLVALQLGGGALTSQNLKLEVETQNTSGVSYPANIAMGDQWDYALDFTGKMDLAGSSGEAKGNDKSHFTALGIESVTVPAGTFNALKVQVDTTLDISVTIQGLTVPVTFSSSYIYWFVQDTGWVKASGSGSIGGEAFAETIEMQWYNLP
ncbi:MAG TPA: hypothetical protein VN653_04755 [Anaerolineales bacterium]|nr:hypothetical protein [Anaerolineales bacterium]